MGTHFEAIDPETLTPNRFYRLDSVQTGKSLEVVALNVEATSAASNDEDQQWAFEYENSGIYRIRNKQANAYLEGDASDHVVVGSYSDSDSQRWELVDKGSSGVGGRWCFVNQASGVYLSLNGTNLKLEAADNSSGQRWYFNQFY